MTAEHKAFFDEPSKAQIGKFERTQARDGLVEKILALSENQYILIQRLLIPADYESSWHFLRHGPRVGLGLGETVIAAVKGARVPVDFRISAFEKLKDTPGMYSGYEYNPMTIRPYPHTDRRVRRVSLVECLEGARLYAYAHQVPGSRLEVEAYTDAQAVAKDGGVFHAHVTSRTKRTRPYRFNLTAVPIVDNRNKWGIAWATATEGHDCLRGSYMGIRYAMKEDSEIFNWCAHEIAAYLAMMESENTKRNRTPLQMSQLALPTQLSVDFYKRLCDSVLIEDPSLAGRDKKRVLNKAEQEILLWGLVSKRGQRATFFAEAHLKDYNWKLRHQD